jgi:transketolase
VPEGVREHFHSQLGQRVADAHKMWHTCFSAYRAQYPELAA